MTTESAIEAAVVGTLGADAKLKTSRKGKPYLSCRIAVGSGDATTWIGIIAFDSSALKNAAALTKGAKAYFEGRLSQTTWTAPDGTQRHGPSLMASYCRLSQIGRAKPKKKREENQSPRARTESAGAALPFDDSVPFAPEWRG
jgi:single-stranded DNA-binding protein